MAKSPTEIRALVSKKKGLLLDLSYGGAKQPRSLTVSPQGDIAHDPAVLPLPLPDGCVNTAVITHVLEFLEPKQWFSWWNDLHRVMQHHGMVYVSGPYGGDESQGWLSDPTHRTRVVEQSFAWLDPRLPFYELHGSRGRTAPKPWHTQQLARVPGTHGTISYNAVLQAVKK